MTVNACPECGCEISAVYVHEDVTIDLNWLELRCLTTWAEAFLRDQTVKPNSRELFTLIIDKLSVYRPEGAEALTVAQQIGEVHTAFPGHNVSRIGDVVYHQRASEKDTVH